MRTQFSWKFSAPLSQVDVPRIIRETGLATTPGRIVVFTIDGRPYTAWRESDYPGLVGPAPNGFYRWYAPSYGSKRPPFRQGNGEVRIWNDRNDIEGTGIRVQYGDHRAALVDLVETRVEVF
jgi:hypothetical protein